MTLAVDPRVLERVTGDLLLRAAALEHTATVPPPDTGSSSPLTEAGLARLRDDAQVLAGDLRRVGGAVRAFARDALGTDGDVSARLHRMAAGGHR